MRQKGRRKVTRDEHRKVSKGHDRSTIDHDRRPRADASRAVERDARAMGTTIEDVLAGDVEALDRCVERFYGSDPSAVRAETVDDDGWTGAMTRDAWRRWMNE